MAQGKSNDAKGPGKTGEQHSGTGDHLHLRARSNFMLGGRHDIDLWHTLQNGYERMAVEGPSNGGRLSCGAPLEGSQTQFYHRPRAPSASVALYAAHQKSYVLHTSSGPRRP